MATVEEADPLDDLQMTSLRDSTCPFGGDHELVPVPDCAAKLCQYPSSVCRYGVKSDKWDCWPVPKECQDRLEEKKERRDR